MKNDEMISLYITREELYALQRVIGTIEDADLFHALDNATTRTQFDASTILREIRYAEIIRQYLVDSQEEEE